MKKICLLSCQSLDGYIVDDELLVRELEQSGEYTVTTIPWDNEADWSVFDLVIIRTTWDYAQRPKEFLKKITEISSQARLCNSPNVVEWNIHKGYLNELALKGAKLVPTHMFKFPGPIDVPHDWQHEKLIIKPAISAGSFKTMIVTREELKKETLLAELFAGDWMLQPFLEEIKKGEISLHFFDKKFSHGIIKIPKEGDFRVQEEFGGNIKPFAPDAELLKLGQDIVNLIPFELLYARVDMLAYQGNYLLMELELIEPALYFSTNSQAVKNFKVALDKIFISP